MSDTTSDYSVETYDSGVLQTPDAPEVSPAEATPAPETAPATVSHDDDEAEETAPPQPRNDHGQFQSRAKKGSAQWRIDQKHWEAEQARRERDFEREQRAALQQRLDALQAAQPSVKPPDPPGKPKLEQFDSYEGYVEAIAEWTADQKLKARDAVTQQQSQAHEHQARRQAWDQHVQAFRQTVADFDDVMHTQADLWLSPVLMEAVLTAGADGPALAYYLGTHPEEALQLTRETEHTPVTAAPLMRRLLSARLSDSRPQAAPSTPAHPAVVVRPAVPAPIKPVGGSHGAVDDGPPDDDASYEVHKAYWDRKDREVLRGR